MNCDARLSLLALFSGLCLAGAPAAAAPGFVAAPAASVSGSSPRFSPMRPIARPGHVRRGRAGFHGGGYSGFYGWPGDRQIVVVQPEASAGPALRVIIASGKFQGVMQATTPIGCLMTTMRLSA